MTNPIFSFGQTIAWFYGPGFKKWASHMSNFIKNLELEEEGFAIAVPFLFCIVIDMDMLQFAFPAIEYSYWRAAHVERLKERAFPSDLHWNYPFFIIYTMSSFFTSFYSLWREINLISIYFSFFYFVFLIQNTHHVDWGTNHGTLVMHAL